MSAYYVPGFNSSVCHLSFLVARRLRDKIICTRCTELMMLILIK